MLVQVASDLHMEFQACISHANKVKLQRVIEKDILPVGPNEEDIVLCLAGDIGQLHKVSTWKWVLEILAERFKAIIYVEGNHGFYGNGYFGQIDLLKREVPLPENVYFLEDDFKIIDGVLFVGSTLWTSMDSFDLNTMAAARRGMNDYMLCKIGNRTLTPDDTACTHQNSIAYIWDALKLEQFKKMKKVVVTHHLPTFKSVSERFKGDLLNHAFASEYFNEIFDCGPDLWIHGHTHDSKDYMINKTRILCNPFGYVGTRDQNRLEYNPNLVVEI